MCRLLTIVCVCVLVQGTHESLRENQKAKATVGAIIDGMGSLGAAFGPLVTGFVSDYFVCCCLVVYYKYNFLYR